MAPDDLNAPLGRDKAKKPSKLARLSTGVPQLLAGVLALSGVVVIGWTAFVDDPLGGEPIAVVSTKPEPGAAADAGPTDVAVAKIAPKETPAAPPAGTQTVTIIDGSSGSRQEVAIPGTQSGAEPSAPKTSADPKLLETTRHGAVPKIGPNGARPSAVYAKPRQLSAAEKGLPRIGIIVGSMGISASGTADALSNLPPTVSFAIAPYGADVDKLAARARGENHEVLLQVPMEPFDFPNNDPGPQTLLASLNSDQNIDRLHWLMSRVQGYVGVMNYMGSRFVTSEQALGPVMREFAKRGLIFVDDGATSRSVAGQLAGGQSLPFAKTDIVLDTVPTPVEVDRALARLEALARDNGSAVGFATAQPATVARLAEWARTVESRGFVLVPITMIAVKPRSS